MDGGSLTGFWRKHKVFGKQKLIDKVFDKDSDKVFEESLSDKHRFANQTFGG